jgi:hypothetical protein
MISKKGGRPSIPTPPGQKVTLSIRTTSAIKAELAAAAEQQGENLSEHADWLLRAGLQSGDRNADYVQQTLNFAVGEDDAGLALVIVQVLRVLHLHGTYLDDSANYEILRRGIGRLFERLAAPDNGATIRDDSPEGRVDNLLWELGVESSGEAIYPTVPLYLEKWAGEQRRRFGARLGSTLIRMNHAVRYADAQEPHREPPQPPLEQVVETWFRAQERAAARRAADEGKPE